MLAAGCGGSRRPLLSLRTLLAPGLSLRVRTALCSHGGSVCASSALGPQTLSLGLECLHVCAKMENFSSPLSACGFETRSGKVSGCVPRQRGVGDSSCAGLACQTCSCPGVLTACTCRLSRATVLGRVSQARLSGPAGKFPQRPGQSGRPNPQAPSKPPPRPLLATTLSFPVRAPSPLERSTFCGAPRAHVMCARPQLGAGSSEASSCCAWVCAPSPGGSGHVYRKDDTWTWLPSPRLHSGPQEPGSGDSERRVTLPSTSRAALTRPFPGFASCLSVHLRFRTCRGPVCPGGREEPRPPPEVRRPRGPPTELGVPGSKGDSEPPLGFPRNASSRRARFQR